MQAQQQAQPRTHVTTGGTTSGRNREEYENILRQLDRMCEGGEDAAASGAPGTFSSSATESRPLRQKGRAKGGRRARNIARDSRKARGAASYVAKAPPSASRDTETKSSSSSASSATAATKAQKKAAKINTKGARGFDLPANFSARNAFDPPEPELLGIEHSERWGWIGPLELIPVKGEIIMAAIVGTVGTNLEVPLSYWVKKIAFLAFAFFLYFCFCISSMHREQKLVKVVDAFIQRIPYASTHPTVQRGTRFLREQFLNVAPGLYDFSVAFMVMVGAWGAVAEYAKHKMHWWVFHVRSLFSLVCYLIYFVARKKFGLSLEK